MMKTCSRCKITKKLNLFSKSVRSPDGFKPACKTCLAADAKAYREVNRDKMEAKHKIWRDANKDKTKAQRKIYCKANRSKVNALQAAYHASKLNASPPWLTDTHKAHIKRTYALAAMMTEATGVPYHVDHIVPLRGKDICGLHVPWNLQALRADLNHSKSNKYEANSSYPQITTTG